jgi:DNA-binding NtrC family response regulator
MPNLDGMGVLARLRQAAIKVPVIVQTDHGRINNVVSAMHAGAVDFVVKPVGAERLQVSLRNAFNTSALEGEIQRMAKSRAGTRGFADIITRSPNMAGVIRIAEKAAASNIPVLIVGESGVGKELIARAIHASGERRTKPFVAVKCGAMPENRIDSILWGHEKVCSNGAIKHHVGKFIEASGGTLFLDEVGELTPAAQVKLLRAIQEGEVEPVGARKPVKIDLRIVSATNRDLVADVKTGRFHRDLFNRLHAFPIAVPPLRERPADVSALVRHFLVRFAAEQGKRIRLIAPDALRLLVAFHWPRNIRQLENAVFRAVLLAEGDSLGLAEFPQISAQATLEPPLSAGPARGADEANEAGFFGESLKSGPRPAQDKPQLPDENPLYSADVPSDAPARADVALLDTAGEVRPLEEVEAEVIRFAIGHYHGQMSEVARRLRISRSTLYRKLEALELPHSAASATRGALRDEQTETAPVAAERQPRKIA